MRFRHLTSAVAQILLNASGGAILQANNLFFVSSKNEGGTVYAIDNNSEILYELNCIELYSRSNTGFGVSPIQVYNGKLYVGANDFPVGIDSGDLSATGAIIAYDAETGIEERKIGIGLGLDGNSEFGRTFKVGSDRIVSMKGWYPYNNQSAVILDLEGNLIAEISDTNVASNVNIQSIEISDNYIFFGDHTNTDQGGTRPGAVHVYDLDGNFVQTLYSPTPSFEEFGYSMTIENNRLFVGARYNSDIGQYIGKIYAFDLTDLSFLNYVYPPNPNNNSLATSLNFGFYLSSSNGYVFAGCENHDAPGEGNDSGAAFIFPANKTTSGSAEVVMLDWPSALGSRSDSHFGSSGVIVGDKVLVGADNSTNNDGAVAIYELDGTLFDTIVSPVIGSDGYQFGNFSAGLEGSYPAKIVIGVGHDGVNPATATIDNKNGSILVSNLGGTEQVELPLPSGIGTHNRFGLQFDMDGTVLVVAGGQLGKAYVYDLTTTNEPFEITGSAPNFGEAVAITGSKIAVGAPGNNTGGIYLYDWDGTSATLATTINQKFNQMGETLAAGNGRIVTGAPSHSNNQGYGAIFDLDGNTIALVNGSTDSGWTSSGANNTYFGRSVAVGNGRIAFSSPGTDRVAVHDLDGNYLYRLEGPDSFASKEIAIGHDKIAVTAHTSPSNQGSVYVYDVEDGSNEIQITGKYNWVGFNLGQGVVIGNNKLIVSGNRNGTDVFVVDIPTLTAGTILDIAEAVIVDDNNQNYFGNFLEVYDTAAAKAYNHPPVITGVQSTYTIEHGSSAVINAVATDVENDAITWSFEEVKSGASYIAVGENKNDGNQVYLYNPDDLSQSPVALGGSLNFSSNERFGARDSIAFSSTHVAIGASGHFAGESSRRGRVYVWSQSDLSGSPTVIDSPSPFGGTNETGANEGFGQAISFIGNDKLIITANGNDAQGFNAGAAYVYDMNDLNAAPIDITPTGLGVDEFDYFGDRIAVNSSYLAIGASSDETTGSSGDAGSVFVYDVSDLTAAPTKILAPETGMRFGADSIAMNSTKLFVSSRNYNGGRGGVYVYDLSDLSATPTIISPSNLTANNYFSHDIAADDDFLVVGAFNKDSGTGAAYLYSMSDLSSDSYTLLSSSTGANPENDQYGYSVAISSDKVMVGARNYGSGTQFYGAAYFFDKNNPTADPVIIEGETAGQNLGEFAFGVSAPSSLGSLTVESDTDMLVRVSDGAISELTSTATSVELLGASISSSAVYGGSNIDVMSFDRNSSDTVLVNHHTAYTYGTGDFTIEGWFNATSTTETNPRNIFTQRTEGGPILRLETNGAIKYFRGGGTNMQTSSATITGGQWHHFAMVRSAGTMTIYLDGTSILSFSETYDFGSSIDQMYIGSYDDTYEFFDGMIHDIRVSNGTARYTEEFTVPTESVSLYGPVAKPMVSQSGNVFTMTHGTADATFTLRITATDAAGNVTSVTTDVTYEAPKAIIEDTSVAKLIVSEGRKTYATDQKVYSLDIDGTNLAEVVSPAGLVQPSSSRYGDNITVSGTNLVVIDPHAKVAYVYDMTSTNAPTSFTLDSTINLSAKHNYILDGNRLVINRNPYSSPGRIFVYNITNGNLDASFANSDNAGFMHMDVGNDKIVAVSGYGDTRKIYTYDIDDTTGSSETIITPPTPANTSYDARVGVGNGKIVYGARNFDSKFYIYNLDGSNEVEVNIAGTLMGSYWGSSYGIPADKDVGHGTISVGNDRIAINVQQPGTMFLCDLDGTNGVALDFYSQLPLSERGTSASGVGYADAHTFKISNNKLYIGAINDPGRIFSADLDGSNLTLIARSPDGRDEYNFGTDVEVYDPSGNTKYANLPAVISNIDAAYTLTEGQDTVITGTAVDPEGDAITWSFEEVKSGASYIAVGANGDDQKANDAGKVYLYDINDLTSSPIQLMAYDGAASDKFGHTVSLSNDKLVVGAWNDDVKGSVYVYSLNDINAQPTKLTAYDGSNDDYFGDLVYVTDNQIVVGAFGDDDAGDRSGSVYVYDISNLSATPTKLTAFDGSNTDFFGNSLAASNDKIVVGAFANDDVHTNSGSVYVYDANDLSAQPTKLTAYDPTASKHFGRDVAIFSDKIVVGAAGENSNTGAAYVYDANDLSAQPTKLTAYDPVVGSNFGFTVDASSDKIIIGAQGSSTIEGSVYVYDANDLSAQPTKLTAYDGAVNEFFGGAVSISSNRLVVGAYGDETYTGSVYVYDTDDLSTQPTKLTVTGAQTYDRIGVSVAAISPASALNDVTVSQSDNVFTVTPGTQDATFTLRFTVTDAAGNVTTKTSTFTYDYVNKAPTVSGIVSEYNLTQGQDTVITASATDPEGDAITWSFEEVGESYIFVKGGNNTYVYDPSTMNLVTTLSRGLTKVSVGSGKFVGVQSNSAYIYDLSDLSAEPIPVSNGVSIDSTAVFDNKLYLGQADQNSNFGQITVYDLNDLNASPEVVTSSSPRSSQSFGSVIKVAGNKLIAMQSRALNEAYGIVQIWDTNDLSAAPTVINNPMNVSLDNSTFGITETHLVFSSVYGYEGSLTHAGTVYVYDLNDLSSPQATVTASSRATSDMFGRYFAVSSKYLMVRKESDQTVHVFDMTDLSAAPVVLNAGPTFGRDFAIVEDALFIGETDVNNTTGRLFVYDGTDLSSAPQEIAGSAEYDAFTADMVGYPAPSALNGVTITQSDNVFTVTPGTADANFTLRITATDSEGNATSVTPTFGYTVPVPVVNDTSVGRIIAAASNNNYSNKIYAFDLDGSNEKELFIPAGMDNSSQFGADENMAIDGTTLVVGQSSEQRVFVYDLATTSEPIEITPSVSSNYFGRSVAISDGKIIVGTTQGAVGLGEFYIYDLDGSNEIKVTEPSAGLPGAGNQNGWTKFGLKVAAGHGRIAIGAPTADADGVTDSGQVYIYDMQGTFINTISATDGQTVYDQFGDYEIAIGNGKIAVAAVNADGGSINSFTGSVYLYDLDGSNEVRLYDPALTGSARFGTGLAIGHEKVVVGSDNGAHFYIFDLDGSNMQKIASTGNTRISVANNRIVVGDYGKNVSETASGELRVYDMSGNLLNTIHQSNPTDRAFLGSSLVMYDTADARAHNFAPTVSGIESAYTLTQGQDTVITASATDPEGDAITWSFEEIVSGSNYVVVGAQTENDNGTRSGAVYVYDASDLSSPATKLNVIGNAADDRLGFSVDISDDKIVVGAPFDDDNGNNAGAVYVFDTNDLSATPTQLTAHDFVPSDEWGDQFGKSVAVTSNKIVVGAMRNTENGYNAGAAYVFDANDLSAQPTKLTAFDGAANDQFGQFVAASDDKIVIASPFDDDNATNSGSVYVYDANDLSAQPTKLTAFDGAASDMFGNSVAATADKIIVGATYDDDNATNSGSVYVYDANDLSAQPTKLTAYDAAANDIFGYSVAANADKIVVGAQRDDDMGGSSGSVYVYDANDLSAQPIKLTAFDGVENDYFGSSVAISGDKIVVGSDQGQFNVYVYDLNDLSAQPEVLTQTDGFGNAVAATSSVSALNGVTVTQSDNVFTVTPGMQDATFQLIFKATDTAGNVTSVTSDFTLDYVNQAPSVTGIESAYTLTQGQDTVITAAGSDVEGDAITWSFEEVMSGSVALDHTSVSPIIHYTSANMQSQFTFANMYFGVFGDNGNKFYAAFVKSVSDRGTIYQYTLSTPYDITTATNEVTYNTNENGGTIVGMNWSPDGSKAIVSWAVTGMNNVPQYQILAFSTPWDISTLDGSAGSQAILYGMSTTLNDNSNVHWGTTWADNGTKTLSTFRNAGVILLNRNSNYQVGSPVSVHSEWLTTDSVISAEINESGTVLTYNIQGGTDEVLYRELSTPWDLSTVGAEQVLIPSSELAGGTGGAVCYDENFEYLIVSDGDGDQYVFKADAPSALNGTTVTQSDNVFTVTPGSEATSFSMRFTATDANGNATSTTSLFTVQESVMPSHPALTGRTIVVGAYSDNELQDNGTVSNSSPGAIYIYKDNIMTKVMPSSIYDTSKRIRFGGVHPSYANSAITSSKIYVTSEQYPYSYDLDGSNEFHFNMQDTSLYSSSVRTKFWNSSFGQNGAIAANDSYVAIGAPNAISGQGSVAIFDPQGNFLYDIDGPQSAGYTFGEKMVMLSNNRLVIGQRTRDNGGTNTGGIYLYSLGNSSASLLNSVYGSTGDQLGSNLATNGSLVVASSMFATGPTGNQYEGFVSVYDSNLTHQFDIEAPDDLGQYDKFGKAVAIGSDKIAVADDTDTVTKVWFYDLSGNPIGAIEGPTNASFAFSMNSIKIFGSGSSQVILISAYGGDEEGTNFGDVWIYDQNFNLIGRLSGFDSGSFGTTIDII